MPTLTGRVPVSGRIASPPTSGLVLWLRADSGVTVSDATITFPNDFDNAAWTKVGATVAANATIDPFGGMLADSLIEDVSVGGHFVLNSIGNLAAAAGSISLYAKAGARNWLALSFAGGGSAVYFDVANGLIGSTVGPNVIGASITPAGNGWYRLQVFSSALTSTYAVFMATADGVSSYAGNGVSNIFLYGAGVSQQKVSAWADQSGLGHHLTQGTAALQPLLAISAENGSVTVRFDATGSDSLASAPFTLNQPEDVFAVGRQITQGSAGVRDIGWDGNTAGSMVLGNILPGVVAISAGSGLSYPGVDLAFPAYDYFECQYNGASSVVNTHGMALGSIGNAGANNAGGFTLGGLANGTRGMNAEYTEILIYNRILSAAERTQLNDYLRWRYDIAQPMPFIPPILSACVLWLRADLGVTLNDTSFAFPDAFDNAAWSKVRSSVTPDTTADPFGTSLADSLIEDATAASTHYINQVPAGLVTGPPIITYSVYAKANTRSWIFMSSDVNGQFFNLGAGTLGTAIGGATVSSIVSQGSAGGGGWYKCSITFPATASGLFIQLANGDNGNSYNGDGVSGVFLFRAAASQPKVSAWADQSGLGNDVTQATAADQPLLVASAQNGRPGVQFDGVNDSLDRAATNFFGSGAYSMVTAQKLNSVVANTAFLSDAIVTAGVAFYLTGGNRTVLHQNVEVHSDAAAVQTPETWVVSRAAASAPTMLLNGTSTALSNTNPAVNDPGAGAVLSVGRFGGLLNYTAVDVYEAICYTRALTLAEQVQLANYLRARYATP